MSFLATHLIGFGAKRAAGGASMSWVSSNSSSSTGLSTITFTAQNIGADAAVRRTVIALGFQSGTLNAATSTIDGVAVTVHVTGTDSNGCNVVIMSADTSGTGTAGDIVLNWSVNANRPAISVYRVVDLVSGTPHATATDTTKASGVVSTTINIPANGVMIAGGYTIDSPGSWTPGTDMTENADIDIAGQANLTSFSRSVVSAETGKTVSSTFSAGGSRGALAAASWS